MGQWITDHRETLLVAGGLSLLAVLVMALALLVTVHPAAAQSGGGYTLTWSNADAAGWTFSSGGGYVLGGTAGQPDAGLLAGGEYMLGGGFWGGGELHTYRFYLPLIARGP
jgi:uncharacterized membrane protein